MPQLSLWMHWGGDDGWEREHVPVWHDEDKRYFCANCSLGLDEIIAEWDDRPLSEDPELVSYLGRIL